MTQLLTAAGRELLTARLRKLDATIADLRIAIDDPEARTESVVAFLHAAAERERLAAVVANAAVVEDVVLDDPEVVDVGDSVIIRLEDGTAEWYVLVHAAEATLDDHRSSIDSPLGRALLGRRVGDVVEVFAPAGCYRCMVLSATRPQSRDAGSRTSPDRARRGRHGRRARDARGQ